MKIIIVGNGKVGYAIASQLAGEHHDITMVDSSPTALHLSLIHISEPTRPY